MTQSTGFKSNAELLISDKLYVQRARIALPILVRQAKNGECIFYSNLAEEIGMPNPRNLNYVLVAIGNALITLEEKLKIKKIPLINCIVINQTTYLPGDGINFFIKKQDFEKLTKNQKRELINRLLAEIYAYPNWDRILFELGLSPLETNYGKKYKPLITTSRQRRESGESKQHLAFKNYLAKHPEIFGLKSEIIGQTEYEFPSMDTMDIRFICKSEIIGVEVKSSISDISDILRGLFQCVKYKALIAAEQKVNDKPPDCSVFLALERKFPDDLIPIKNLLGIQVIDKINMC